MGKWKSLNLVLILSLIMISGCSGIMPSFSLGGSPRPRVGYMPISKETRIPFPDADKLGKHSASIGLGEVGGMMFTCRGGHVDIDHVRGNADGTRYLVKKIQNTLSKNEKEFSYKIGGEPSSHKITFTYPADWSSQPNKQQIIDEIAYSTAPYIEFQCTTWHEMLTWFGYHFALIEPEFNSAFSWEDNYSNLLGCIIGAEAAQDKQHSYDEAVTSLIYKKLKELDVQPGEAVGRPASAKVKGDWWIDGWVPDMKYRSFDIGLKGCITPVIVPGIAQCQGAEPYCLPAPKLDTSA